MKYKKSNIIVYIVLVFVSAIMIYPVFDMIVLSLLTEKELSSIPRLWLPSTPHWSNYIKALHFPGDYNGMPLMLLYFKNTLLIIFGIIFGGVLSASMCAYGFSKIKFPGRDQLFFIVLATLMIPTSITMIPLFIVFKQLHWINTLLPLWVPAWFGGGATSIFLLRQFMKGIPDTFLQSASIDGAGHIRIFFQIILPNCIPIIMVIVISYITTAWNDFFTPLIYINVKHKWTLAIGIANILQTGEYGDVMTKQNFMMAACTLMTVFPIALFCSGQKYFIENVVISGIKG